MLTWSCASAEQNLGEPTGLIFQIGRHFVDELHREASHSRTERECHEGTRRRSRRRQIAPASPITLTLEGGCRVDPPGREQRRAAHLAARRFKLQFGLGLPAPAGPGRPGTSGGEDPGTPGAAPGAAAGAPAGGAASLGNPIAWRTRSRATCTAGINKATPIAPVTTSGNDSRRMMRTS